MCQWLCWIFLIKNSYSSSFFILFSSLYHPPRSCDVVCPFRRWTPPVSVSTSWQDVTEFPFLLSHLLARCGYRNGNRVVALLHLLLPRLTIRPVQLHFDFFFDLWTLVSVRISQFDVETRSRTLCTTLFLHIHNWHRKSWWIGHIAGSQHCWFAVVIAKKALKMRTI